MMITLMMLIVKMRKKWISAPELPALERRNWLIHLHYVRREYEVLIPVIVNINVLINIIINVNMVMEQVCKRIIKQQLAESHSMCEYANYVQVALYLNPSNPILLAIAPRCYIRQRRHYCFVNLILQGLILRQEGKIQESLEQFQVRKIVSSKKHQNCQTFWNQQK